MLSQVVAKVLSGSLYFFSLQAGDAQSPCVSEPQAECGGSEPDSPQVGS